MKRIYPYNFTTTVIIIIYQFVWFISLPFVVIYLVKRSLREPAYRKNLSERFGFGKTFVKNSIWIHAVSLGEFRASVPLVKKLLQRSENIIITTITPAGRQEALSVLKKDIKKGNVRVAYLPLEYSLAFNFFLQRFRPKLAIILEYELWPVMIASCCRFKVPLVLAQGQYVKKSFKIDKRFSWLRPALFNGFDLILAKSQHHADRYKFFSKTPIEIMGELRFDQKVSSEHLKKADLLCKKLGPQMKSRVCFCFGSTGIGEDTILFELMARLTKSAERLGHFKPFYIYVPRHMKDLFLVEKELLKSKLIFVDRSKILDDNLNLNNGLSLDSDNLDGLLGDSIGEINFYFQMADYIFIGNSFNELGAHNVIEPLALKKPVFVGPSIWGIEYPIIEALEAKVTVKVNDADELYNLWLEILSSGKKIHQSQDKFDEFYTRHSGAAERCLENLEKYGFI